jgi:hypothetical protein
VEYARSESIEIGVSGPRTVVVAEMRNMKSVMMGSRRCWS